MVALAAGARDAQQLHNVGDAGGAGSSTALPAAASQRSLVTYYFDVFKPQLQLLPASGSREGRTPLRLTLRGADTVSAHMPVVVPSTAGMTHQVVNTWSALRGYAAMFARANAINRQAPGGPRLFPRPAVALASAAAASPTGGSDGVVKALVDAAEAEGRRGAWTEAAPGTMLLMPAGQAATAVADVMDVSYDEAADTIAMDLDLVHRPHTISEFEPHGKQTLEADTSHYHFYVEGGGAKLDAAQLLQALAESRYELAALHVFSKVLLCPYTYTLTNQGPSQYNTGYTTIRVDATQPTVCSMAADHGTSPPAPQQPAAGAQRESGGAAAAATAAASCTISASAKATSDTAAAPELAALNCKYCPASTPGCNKAIAEAQGGERARLEQAVSTVPIRMLGIGPSPLSALFDVRPAPGTVTTVTVTTIGAATATGTPLVLRGSTPVGPATRLALGPATSYRRVHERAVLTAQALDAAGAAVPGVTVAFGVAGDCDASVSLTQAVTDAAGRASVLVWAARPGAVAVVAAAAPTRATRLVTPAAHVIFFEERRYVEHKERHYYGRGYEDRWSAEAYTNVQSDADSDAERFAAKASKQALALLPA